LTVLIHGIESASGARHKSALPPLAGGTSATYVRGLGRRWTAGKVWRNVPKCSRDLRNDVLTPV
jgi:hypothetical protein